MPSNSCQQTRIKRVLSLSPTLTHGRSSLNFGESSYQDETSSSICEIASEREFLDMRKKYYDLDRDHISFDISDFDQRSRPFIEKLKMNLTALYSGGVFPLNDRDLIDKAIDAFRETDQEKEKVNERKLEIMARSKARKGNYHKWTAKKSLNRQKTTMNSDKGTEPPDNFNLDFKGHLHMKTWNDEDVSEMSAGQSMSQLLKKDHIVINRGFDEETVKTINRLGPKP